MIIAQTHPPPKRCTRCGELKARSDFYRLHSALDGLQSRCKTCQLRPSPPSARRNTNVAGRFAAAVTRAENGCWQWTGKLNHLGYGLMFAGQRTRSGRPRSSFAHRVAYELHVGAIPSAMEIDHLCRNRRCVNPSHLEVVSHAENQRRMRLARSAA